LSEADRALNERVGNIERIVTRWAVPSAKRYSGTNELATLSRYGAVDKWFGSLPKTSPVDLDGTEIDDNA